MSCYPVSNQVIKSWLQAPMIPYEIRAKQVVPNWGTPEERRDKLGILYDTSIKHLFNSDPERIAKAQQSLTRSAWIGGVACAMGLLSFSLLVPPTAMALSLPMIGIILTSSATFFFIALAACHSYHKNEGYLEFQENAQTKVKSAIRDNGILFNFTRGSPESLQSLVQESRTFFSCLSYESTYQ